MRYAHLINAHIRQVCSALLNFASLKIPLLKTISMEGDFGVTLEFKILTYAQYAAVFHSSQALVRKIFLPLSASARHSSSKLDSALAYSQT